MRQAAADDLIDALGTVAVNVHDLCGATCGHFQCEVLDEFIELAIRQLAVFNQSLGHLNSLFLNSCSIQAPKTIVVNQNGSGFKSISLGRFKLSQGWYVQATNIPANCNIDAVFFRHVG